MIRKIFLAALSLWLPAVQAQDITLRHDLSGQPLDALATLVVRFNGEQKGKARVMLQDLKGVAEKQQTPHLALLDPDDSTAFFGTSPRFLPLHKVMADSKLKLDAKMFFPQMAAAVDDLTGKIQALPLAQALPVLFYNRDAFLRAGLDPDNPPKTWWEVQTAAGKLFDAGYKCPLTASRFAWVHLDNMSSQHGEPMLARDGKIDRVALNTMVHVKHIALLASWQKSFYFHYFGPGREGDAKFMSGECSMLTGESPLYRELQKSSGFRFGVAELPLLRRCARRPPGRRAAGWRGAVGAARQAQGRVRGGRALRRIHDEAREPARMGPGHGLPADDGRRRRRPQDRRNAAGAARQGRPAPVAGAFGERADQERRRPQPHPRHPQRGNRVRLGQQEAGQGGARYGDGSRPGDRGNSVGVATAAAAGPNAR